MQWVSTCDKSRQVTLVRYPSFLYIIVCTDTMLYIPELSVAAEAVLKMLTLNQPLQTGKDLAEVYKVLVYDKYCQDIIAPLMHVSELRRHGVTLHLLIGNERQPIPDVPAIYFIQPTQANIQRVIQDASQQLYDTMHINFVSSASRSALEQLAAGAVQTNSLARLSKVYDQYLSFVALEPNLFSLGLPNAYVDLNDPTARDSDIEAAVEGIVEGLFCVLVALGVVPIIRCPKGGAAEHVAGLLDAKLRDHLKQRSNLFTEGISSLAASISRPLLCLFDRNYDLSAVLQHTWSYKPLVHDVLGLHLNRVSIASDAPANAAIAAGPAKKSYDVDEKDFFWETCGSHPFPKVAEEVEAQVKRYQAAVDEITQKTLSSDSSLDQDELLRRSTQNLMSAVSSLPDLQDKKRTVDKHFNLAHALFQRIRARTIDQYYNFEEDLLTGKGDLGALVKLVQAKDLQEKEEQRKLEQRKDAQPRELQLAKDLLRERAADKLRVALVYLLSVETLPSEAELSELTSVLLAAGCEMFAFHYVKMLRRNNLIGAMKGGADSNMAGLGMASQGNLLEWADKTFGQGFSTVTKSVKNLLLGARQAPITTALESLTDCKVGTPEFETFCVFDPKGPVGRANPQSIKGPFREAMVFAIGGGNYLERETIGMWAARQVPPKAFMYGATDMVSGEQFLQQLAELGRRSGAH